MCESIVKSRWGTELVGGPYDGRQFVLKAYERGPFPSLRFPPIKKVPGKAVVHKYRLDNVTREKTRVQVPSQDEWIAIDGWVVYRFDTTEVWTTGPQEVQ